MEVLSKVNQQDLNMRKRCRPHFMFKNEIMMWSCGLFLASFCSHFHQNQTKGFLANGQERGIGCDGSSNEKQSLFGLTIAISPNILRAFIPCSSVSEVILQANIAWLEAYMKVNFFYKYLKDKTP